MSAEQNKKTVRTIFEEVLTTGDQQRASELVAPGYVNHSFPLPQPGPEGLVQLTGMFRAAFPDIRVTLEDVLAEDDRVATRGYFIGTHRGEFMDVPATGKSVRVAYADVWRLENGKVAENWVQMDLLGLMQQLGAAPAPVGA